MKLFIFFCLASFSIHAMHEQLPMTIQESSTIEKIRTAIHSQDLIKTEQLLSQLNGTGNERSPLTFQYYVNRGRLEINTIKADAAQQVEFTAHSLSTCCNPGFIKHSAIGICCLALASINALQHIYKPFATHTDDDAASIYTSIITTLGLTGSSIYNFWMAFSKIPAQNRYAHARAIDLLLKYKLPEAR